MIQSTRNIKSKGLKPSAGRAKVNRPSAPDNADTLVVKLRATDQENADGSPMIQLFKYNMAQRILDTKHPFKGWVLDDTAYKMDAGAIVPITVTEASAAILTPLKTADDIAKEQIAEENKIKG